MYPVSHHRSGDLRQIASYEGLSASQKYDRDTYCVKVFSYSRALFKACLLLVGISVYDVALFTCKVASCGDIELYINGTVLR
jgi:hypothetical protein